jgi:hypothetical protein
MFMYVIFEKLRVITFVDFFPELFDLLFRINPVNHHKFRCDIILTISLQLLLLLLVIVEYEGLLVEFLVDWLD